MLGTFDFDRRDALFAHCVSLSVNAVHEGWNRRPRAFAHADRLAQAIDLDMAKSWSPTAANFLGRVTKARILQAVAEGKGERAADRIEHLRKVEMATEAETLLAGTGWLPEPLRTPGRARPEPVEPAAETIEPEMADAAEVVEAEEPVGAEEPVEADDLEPFEAEAFDPTHS